MLLSDPISQTRRSGNHAFLIVSCLAAFAVVAAGFAPTYYLRPWFQTTSLPLLLHVHGALMTAWFALFLIQVTLVATHRTQWHRRLGIAGALLAAAIVVMGTITDVRWAGRALHEPPQPGPPTLEFFGFLLFALIIFALLVGAAIGFRRRRDVHSRLMLLACISMIGPGVFRIPFPRDSFLGSGGPGGLFSLDLLILYGCIAYDTWKYRRLHPAFLVGGVMIAAESLPFIWLVLGTETWKRVAFWLVG